jgi:hypothetical protein
MDSENDYEIVPANNTCSSNINKQLVIPTPGTTTSQNLNNVNAIGNQHIEDSKYDDTDAIQVKPMYGGNVKNLKTFKIIFRKKKYLVNSNNELNAINNLLSLKNSNYKKDYLIHIEELNKINKNNFYVLESNNKNNKNNKNKKINKNNKTNKYNIKKLYQ